MAALQLGLRAVRARTAELGAAPLTRTAELSAAPLTRAAASVSTVRRPAAAASPCSPSPPRRHGAPLSISLRVGRGLVLHAGGLLRAFQDCSRLVLQHPVDG